MTGTLIEEQYFVLSLLIDILRWGIFEYIFLIILCMNAFISVHIKKDAHLFIFCNTYFCDHDLVII